MQLIGRMTSPPKTGLDTSAGESRPNLEHARSRMLGTPSSSLHTHFHPNHSPPPRDCDNPSLRPAQATRGPARPYAVRTSRCDPHSQSWSLDERLFPRGANGYISESDVMNQTSTTRVWSPIASAPDDEFGNFLEFGDLQLDFPSFERVAHDGRTDRQDVDTDTSMDATMENAPTMVDFGIAHLSQQPQQSTSNPLMSYNGMGQLFNMPMSREQFHESQHPHLHIKTQRQYHPGMVPPTPSSIEMHGGMPGYYHTPVHQQPQAYEYYQRSQRDQVNLLH